MVRLVRSLGCAICLFIFAGVSAADTRDVLTPEQAIDYLKITPKLSITGKFSQKKYFTVLSQPITSSGIFNSSNNTFLWQTEKPVKSVLIFDGTTLWQEDNQSNRTKLPITSSYVQVLKSMVIGDFITLSNYFVFQADVQRQCVMLIPKSSELSLIAKEIRLCGKLKISQVTLFETNNNRTEITLSYYDVNKRALAKG